MVNPNLMKSLRNLNGTDWNIYWMLNKENNMEVIKTGLLVDNGEWFAVLTDVYLGNSKVNKWKDIELKINWIDNPKIMVYIWIKMIRGDSLHEAINRIFSKSYWEDPDYLIITK